MNSGLYDVLNVPWCNKTDAKVLEAPKMLMNTVESCLCEQLVS